MINLVVSLPAEARPLVNYLGLAPTFTHGPFRCYNAENISLIVSGVGKLNVAAAVAYLHAMVGGKSSHGWLNVGIAGHRSLKIGDGYLASSVRDAKTSKEWRPKRLLDSKLQEIDLVSLEQPTETYEGDVAYDMEASAVFEIATRCTAEGMIQCFKIISDNLSNGPNRVSATQVEQLVNQRMVDIEHLLSILAK